MQTQSSPLSFRPREAAKALGISPRTLWGLTAPRGPIPCARVGLGKRRAVLYPRAALETWLAEQAGQQATAGSAPGAPEGGAQ